MLYLFCSESLEVKNEEEIDSYGNMAQIASFSDSILLETCALQSVTYVVQGWSLIIDLLSAAAASACEIGE